MAIIKVRFTRFWKGFNPNSNFLTQIIENSGHEVQIVEKPNLECDIEFVSVYAGNVERVFQAFSIIKHRMFGSFKDVAEKYENLNLPRTRNAKRMIWLTGENLRPPFINKLDGFLSFDENLLENNAYLPIWYFDAGFFGEHFVERVGVSTSINKLMTARSIQNVPPKFACMFAGNPHSVRLQFAEILEKYGEIEKYGLAFGTFVKYKYPVGRQFKFTIAFENDNYPGYVTEKLLEAYLTESVPIYWGNLGVNSPINPKAILIKKENQSLTEFASEIAKLSESEILEKLNQPFLLCRPPVQDILKVVLGDEFFGK